MSPTYRKLNRVHIAIGLTTDYDMAFGMER